MRYEGDTGGSGGAGYYYCVYVEAERAVAGDDPAAGWVGDPQPFDAAEDDWKLRPAAAPVKAKRRSGELKARATAAALSFGAARGEWRDPTGAADADPPRRREKGAPSAGGGAGDGRPVGPKRPRCAYDRHAPVLGDLARAMVEVTAARARPWT